MFPEHVAQGVKYLAAGAETSGCEGVRKDYGKYFLGKSEEVRFGLDLGLSWGLRLGR